MRSSLAPLPSRRRAAFLTAAATAAALTAATLAIAPTATASTSAISGRVTDGTGAPVAGVEVMPYVFTTTSGLWGREPANKVETDEDGRFVLTGLAATRYKVGFEPDEDRHVPEFYDDADDLDAATVLHVSSGSTTSGVDAVLRALPHLGGTVTDGSGTPLPDVAVTAHRREGESTDWSQVGWATTDADGTYNIPALPAGEYKVEFNDDDNGDLYDNQWFDAATSFEAADVVELAPDAPRSDVDAVLLRNGEPATVRNQLAPEVWGSPTVGSELEAFVGTWTPRTDVDLTWQWLADGTPIAGSTDQLTYTPTSDELGRRISLRVTATRAGFTSATADSAPTAPIEALPPTVNTAAPVVTGDPVVGGELVADPGTWTPSPDTVDYQWLVGDEPVPGAEGDTYTPAAADAGETVAVRVTATAPGRAPGTVTSAATAAVVQRVVTNLTAPAVSDVPLVGRPLTATPGTWDPSDEVALDYAWLAGDDVVASGPSATTYTPSVADLGKPLSVRVTASRTHFTPAMETSAPTAPVDLPAVAAGTPRVDGTAAVGNTLTAEEGTWPAGAVLGYQWLADGEPIDDATDETYVVPAGDVGRRLSVRVTGSLPLHHDGVATSAESAPVAERAVAASVPPVVQGAPQVGTPVTASTGTWSPADTELSYQWFAGGTAINGADESRYTPVVADVGKALTVRVTGARTGYATGHATSQPSAPVAAAPVPTVTGTPQVGQRLTAQPGNWTSSPSSFGYEWLVGGSVVPGQTASTFDIPPTALGKTVAVRVTVPDAVPVTSAATTPVKAGVFRVARAPTVTGPARVGKTLRATAGVVSPTATKATYQWLRNGRAIARATKATYKLTRTDKGKKLSVRVTYVRTGYTTLQKASRATGKVG